MIDAIGFGIVMPVLPQLVNEHGCAQRFIGGEHGRMVIATYRDIANLFAVR